MKRIYIDEDLGTYVEYTGDVMAIYSPQILRVVYDRSEAITLVIGKEDELMGDIIEQTRYPVYEDGMYVTTFEISRMLQIMSDPEEALKNISYNTGNAKDFCSKIQIVVSATSQLLDSPITISGLFAACDALEEIGSGDKRIRFYTNHPQTLSIDQFGGECMIQNKEGDDAQITAGDTEHLLQFCYAKAMAGSDDLDALQDGEAITNHFTCSTLIYNGQDQFDYDSGDPLWKKILLEPDLTPFGQGVYLRWLQRDGTLGYWLFTKSKKIFSASAGKSFSRYIDGVEAAPDGGILRNKARGDFRIGETLTIGTAKITEEEYEMLCGLGCSPIVDMLVGGTAISPLWMRVNVIAGSYTREYPKSGLERLADFELSIVLPERNTIKL